MYQFILKNKFERSFFNKKISTVEFAYFFLFVHFLVFIYFLKKKKKEQYLIKNYERIIYFYLIY